MGNFTLHYVLLGMQREGLLRQDKLVIGSWCDNYLYSIFVSDI